MCGTCMNRMNTKPHELGKTFLYGHRLASVKAQGATGVSEKPIGNTVLGLATGSVASLAIAFVAMAM